MAVEFHKITHPIAPTPIILPEIKRHKNKFTILKFQ